MEAIADAVDPLDSSEVVLVLSDRPGIAALDKAMVRGIETVVLSRRGNRAEMTREICLELDKAGAELVVLAGFMRILGPEAIDLFGGRIVNVHPSLLPSFPGVGAVRQALDAGVGVTGVTVHFVDEKVDHGPIIEQRPVAIRPGDTEQSLHARIQEVEHDLYPAVVVGICEGRIALQAVGG